MIWGRRYTRDHNPICYLSWTIPAQWFYCSMNPLCLTLVCRELSMKIAIDNRYFDRFFHIRIRIFSANHSRVALCLQSRLHSGSTHMHDTLPFTSWDLKTLMFRRNYKAKYGIVTRRLIHKGITTVSLHVIPHNCSEINRLVVLPIIAH